MRLLNPSSDRTRRATQAFPLSRVDDVDMSAHWEVNMCTVSGHAVRRASRL